MKTKTMNEQMEIKCQCDETGTLQIGWEWSYDEKKELPYVNHAPNECKCTNELKRYLRDGKEIWLCSCCCMGDEEVK
jgi:hypothetical protein